jgi:uncharacterized protein with HEPN domain
LGGLAAELSPNIPWKDVRGLGNRLRHEYANIDVVRLWRVVERDLPVLKAGVRSALVHLEMSE